MLIKTMYVRFYKSFNYDYLRKFKVNTDEGEPWDNAPGSDLFYPFVQVDMEAGITTVVGANESGKSQLIGAVKRLLTGEGIETADFCRYSEFLTVDGQMLHPEFGAEFTDLTDEDRETVRALSGAAEGAVIDTFWFFRLNRGPVLYVRDGDEILTKELKPAEIKRIAFPIVFEIDATVPLPESIPIDYLAANDAKRKPRSRRKWLDLFSKFRENPDWFSSKEKFTGAAQSLTFSGEESVDEEESTLKSYELADDMLVTIGGIDRSAFKAFQKAARDETAYADGLLGKMNERLDATLNFRKWWSQDREFGLSLDRGDFDLLLSVHDRTGRKYAFSERSGGMKYFLSYFVQALAHKPAQGQEILLMDEPDAFLSTAGQQDLLRLFDSFAYPEDPAQRPLQVLYVTHSPFLIDKNHGERLRVLEKGDGEEGTRVVRNAAQNHYEPLRSAFGAFVAETTFIGNCNLFVEGQADQVLLAGMSSLSLRLRKQAETLDLNTLTLVPAGGASHIPYLVYLARGRDIDKPAVIVLLDGDKAGEDAKRELQRGYRKKRLVADRHVLHLGDLPLDQLSIDTDGVRDLEDLIPADVALVAIGKCAEEALGDDAPTVLTALKPFSVPTGQKLFAAAEQAAVDASGSLDRPLTLDKVAFARAVVEATAQATAEVQDRILGNFHVLFARLAEMQRNSMSETTHERISRTINRLRANFLKDHPTTATKSQVTILLEEVERQLVDASDEAESIRRISREIASEFQLSLNPRDRVENYELLAHRLKEMAYKPLADVQND
ncbi:hypothetical protein CGZ93_07965 [Enemella dayhoffiae]|uniref:ATPase AAA-type core domain-containing protein n=1 Tax=Enemella dayhoffiae TaxID=2016507 RepID=A0A255H4A7_9ACTN|nr:AAA family ATPase [Enemella dayhoffiae]OYO21873.1 hypothetical protein CGZ93_07965 [Enemella dayhoffiae]